MARKNLLAGLMGQSADPADSSGAPETKQAPSPATARSGGSGAARPRSGGAVGAVSRSIADLKSRSVVEIDPRMIDSAGLQDRLDPEGAEMEGLVYSIRDYGQQVPVLVRVSPNDPERYQIVYGRRRVAALRRLDQPVKALVRDLDDRALILAQGQENTARKELSFIEKANFARQMRESGYDRKVIGDALGMDKTLISRLLSVTDALPAELIRAIGAAPSVGRERWVKLAKLAAGRDLVAAAKGPDSESRFAAVMAEAVGPKPTRGRQSPHQALRPLALASGQQVGQVRRASGRLTVTLEAAAAEGFDDWLADNLDRILSDWETGRDGQGGDPARTNPN